MQQAFVSKLKQNLFELLSLDEETRGETLVSLLVAVSGGADSISLMSGLCELSKTVPIRIVIATINHNLRKFEETSGDADFVEAFSKQHNVRCCRFELDGNAIRTAAIQKKCGLEAAARHVRYKTLETCRQNEHCAYIVTAHNKDDYFETILMRLFQGGNPESLDGLQAVHGCIIRPMLNISRQEIITYLQANNIAYREDSSNFEQQFLRNKIRLNLVPILQDTFPHWQKSLAKTITKIQYDCDAIKQLVEPNALKNALEHTELFFQKQKNLVTHSNTNSDTTKTPQYDSNHFLLPYLRLEKKDAQYVCVKIDGQFFLSSHIAIKRRLLQEAFFYLGVYRVSHEFTEQCLQLKPGRRCELKEFVVHFKRKMLLIFRRT